MESQEHAQPIYSWVQQHTDQVARQLDEELAKTPLLGWLTAVLVGMVYNAAQKLIDRKHQTEIQVPQHEAIILSCSRVSIECFAGHRLLRQGLILPAIEILRVAFETSTQATLFIDRSDLAAEWLEGRRIKPATVRKLSAFAESKRELYRLLSDSAHPNVEAAGYHAADLPDKSGIALTYGGSFRPKLVGQLSAQFLFPQLVFLESFYTTFGPDLGSLGLLWSRESGELFKSVDQPMTWDRVLELLRGIASSLVEEFEDRPDDQLGLEAHFRSVLSR